MSDTGAARIDGPEGPEWFHYSRLGDTLKLRRFEGGTAYDWEVDASDIDEWLPLSECKNIYPNEPSYSITVTAVWTKLLAALNAGNIEAAEVPSKTDASGPLVVPITRLRRYYASLKVFEKDLFLPIGEFYKANPDSLEKLWNDSYQQFSEYQNQEDWGIGEREELPPIPERLSDVKKTNEFTSYVNKHGLANTGYTIVARELNPWRTRKGQFPNKKPATRTGRGGMDLLLHAKGGIPVVGEVKIAKDKNALFALLQALTYAVELSTPNQLKRLHAHYPDKFKSPSQTSCVNVAVILVNPVDDPTRDSVKAIAQKLNKRQHCKALGRVILIESSMDEWATFS